MNEIVISGLGSISPLGATEREAREMVLSGKSAIIRQEIAGEESLVAPISSEAERSLFETVVSDPRYAALDRSVQLAIHAARSAARAGMLSSASGRTGVNIGSSRGATGLLEKSITDFVKSGRVPAATSPTTTLGNISSWVAQDLKLGGFAMSHSVTCSTGMHALLNGIAWIRAGLCDRVLAGAAEAALTPFTIAQMRALRIYSRDHQSDFPCRPLGDPSVENDGMVLGEAAAVALLERKEDAAARGLAGRQLMTVEGFGFAIEQIQSATGISESGEGFEFAMRQAIENLPPGEAVDCVILHAPGTKKGDAAELSALSRVFGAELPLLTSNKWIAGHTFGTAGMLGIELASQIFAGVPPPAFRYPTLQFHSKRPARIRRILVNAAGFGGNTVSVLLRG